MNTWDDETDRMLDMDFKRAVGEAWRQACVSGETRGRRCDARWMSMSVIIDGVPMRARGRFSARIIGWKQRDWGDRAGPGGPQNIEYLCDMELLSPDGEGLRVLTDASG